MLEWFENTRKNKNIFKIKKQTEPCEFHATGIITLFLLIYIYIYELIKLWIMSNFLTWGWPWTNSFAKLKEIRSGNSELMNLLFSFPRDVFLRDWRIVDA